MEWTDESGGGRKRRRGGVESRGGTRGEKLGGREGNY